MSVSTMHRSRPNRGGDAPRLFWGWSHDNARMEMMDLPGYIDSLREGYERAVEDYGQQYPAMAGGYGTGTGTMRQTRGRHDRDRDCGCGEHHTSRHGGHGRHHQHEADCGCGHHSRHNRDDCGCGEHRRHHRHGRDCGCGGDHDDCRCECCVSEDADIVVYARCGEVRVIPIEIENELRRAREDVSLEVSDVRSAGGRNLGWQVQVDKEGPLTLEPCSTTTLELTVQLACRDDQGRDPADQQPAPAPAAKGSKAAAAATEQQLPDRRRVDVDRCEVGYVTVRLGGCLIRPIVVAIAAVPAECGSYSAGCSCSCC